MVQNSPSLGAKQPAYSGAFSESSQEVAPPERMQQQLQQPVWPSPEIESICKLDPAREAARVANLFWEGVGKVDPLTGQVRTREWVIEQGNQMRKYIEDRQREFRCGPI